MDFGSEFGAVQTGRAFRNPGISLCHVAFRSAALLVYLFGGMFSSSFIGVFVAVVLLLSVDFWTVKNVTGRIMVGLRWWNYIDENGDSQWMFEKRNGDSQHLLSATEVRFFWVALVAAPFLWLILFLTAFFSFKFQWLVLVTIGLTLSGSNMLGYLRCKMGGGMGEGSISNMANAYIQKSMMNNMANIVTSTLASAKAAASGTSTANQKGDAFNPQDII